MFEAIQRLLPILVPFFVGLLLRRFNIFSTVAADRTLKFVFCVSVPALVLFSFSPIQVSYRMLALPIAAAVVFFFTLAVAYLAARQLKLDRSTQGTFIIGSAFMNSSFIYPVALAFGGHESFVIAFLFDIGNGVLVLSLGYFIACYYGEGAANIGSTFQKVLKSPPLVALAVALLLARFELPLPQSLLLTLERVGSVTTPLIMIALGIYLRPSLHHHRLLSRMIAIRMIGGFVIGVSCARLLGLEPSAAAVVAAGASAPCGYTTLIFSSLANLDRELAASAVSISLLVGLVTVPLMLLYL